MLLVPVVVDMVLHPVSQIGTISPQDDYVVGGAEIRDIGIVKGGDIKSWIGGWTGIRLTRSDYRMFVSVFG